jgi:hypothetical protein
MGETICLPALANTAAFARFTALVLNWSSDWLHFEIACGIELMRSDTKANGLCGRTVNTKCYEVE